MCDEYKLLFKICLVSVQAFFHLTVTYSSCKLLAMTEVSTLQYLVSIICRNQGGCISEPLFLTALSASLQMFSGFDENIFLQQWFFKSKPQTHSIRVTWKHIRNADPQAPHTHRPTRSETCGGGGRQEESNLCFNSFSEASQRMQWHPAPVLLPGKSQGRRRLVGCSPWGR